MVRILTKLYSHTPVVLRIHGCDLCIHHKRGMKERCPLSPTLFLLSYDVLLWETLSRHPDALLYIFIDETAVRAADQTTLLDALNHLYRVTYRLGLTLTRIKPRPAIGSATKSPEP